MNLPMPWATFWPLFGQLALFLALWLIGWSLSLAALRGPALHPRADDGVCELCRGRLDVHVSSAPTLLPVEPATDDTAPIHVPPVARNDIRPTRPAYDEPAPSDPWPWPGIHQEDERRARGILPH
jgi:hypothetical protein